MAQSAPPKDKTDGKNPSSQLAPPDERFWQRYSPHAEFPLSSAGSFVLHLLIFGVLGLMAWLGAMLFNNSSRSLPVEAVRLDLGGGGGNPHGRGDGENNGQPKEAVPQQNEGTAEKPPPEDAPLANIAPPPIPQVKPQFDPERLLELPNTPNSQAFKRLSRTSERIRVPDRSNKSSGHGQGGTGKGGGSGEGSGTGVGNREGEGRGNLTQREKRMLRWTMNFKADSSEDYLAQLAGLGAILAIPVREQGGNREYKIVRDLKARPATLVDEDVSKIQRIYWIDDKPRSVAGVMAILGLRLPSSPSHFYAFMPEELEQKLYRLEKDYLNKHYPRKTEDNIVETKFDISIRGGKYEPEVAKYGLKVK